jgi:hypothetical protein
MQYSSPDKIRVYSSTNILLSPNVKHDLVVHGGSEKGKPLTVWWRNIAYGILCETFKSSNDLALLEQRIVELFQWHGNKKQKELI